MDQIQKLLTATDPTWTVILKDTFAIISVGLGQGVIFDSDICEELHPSGFPKQSQPLTPSRISLNFLCFLLMPSHSSV